MKQMIMLVVEDAMDSLEEPLLSRTEKGMTEQ
jgi:hypothetical protein